ncbi:Pre-mRNA-processing factor 19 [Grifola frondosa]|uniref:Pre-mRNA-processing factor 19 n=1 Tax=Grifola frondosa TaxID=5627 RepID=A0A1C7MQV5_GRIFR|nr:Pre-mRNA-processing factor 19 [Grifola frondosa]
MSFFCSISGDPLKTLLSRRNKLEEADLISVKANPKTAAPRPPTATSIPALLHTLQNEWDATIIETFTLRQQYNSMRQELSYALALANVSATIGVAPPAAGDVEMAEAGQEAGALPENIMKRIDETHQTLSAARKKRKAPAGYATAAEVKTFTAKHTIPSLHSPSPAGITALAAPTPARPVPHRRRKAWAHDTASGEYIPKATIRTHKGELTGLVVHPTSTLLALASADRTYSLHDLTTFEQVYRSPEADEPYTSLAVHPDGMLLALGTPGSTVQVFDVRIGAAVASLTPPDSVPFTVNTVSFSENGYHLLAPDSLSSVAVWDLRKPKIAHSIALGEGFKVNKVRYDTSALLLVWRAARACGCSRTSPGGAGAVQEGGEVTDFVYGEQGREIWGATGREVRIWGLPA